MYFHVQQLRVTKTLKRSRKSFMSLYMTLKIGNDDSDSDSLADIIV